MQRKLFVALVIACVGSIFAQAEKIELYRLSEAGVDTWIWGDARIKSKLGKFIVSEHNKKGNTGGVYTADKFPYFEDGVIELDVLQVLSGNYTLQMLGFKGDNHLDTLELITSAEDAGQKAWALKGRNINEKVERVVFKFWVGSAEGASTKLADLAYAVAIDDDDVLLDERFDDKTRWELDNTLLGDAADGVVWSPVPGASYGSILYKEQVALNDVSALFFELDDVQNGDTTLQLVLLDPEGNYIKSIDALQKVTSGTHAVRLDHLPIPEGADSFTVKIWIGGGAAVKAKLKRLLLVKP